MKWLVVVLAACSTGGVSGTFELAGEGAVAPTQCVDAAAVFGLRDGSRMFVRDRDTDGAVHLTVSPTPEGPLVMYHSPARPESFLTSCRTFDLGATHLRLDCTDGEARLRADLRFGTCITK